MILKDGCRQALKSKLMNIWLLQMEMGYLIGGIFITFINLSIRMLFSLELPL